MSKVYKYWDGRRWVECTLEQAKKHHEAGTQVIERDAEPKHEAPAPLPPPPAKK